MSTEVVLKGFFAGLFSLAFAWSVFSRYDKEIGSESKPEGGQRYLPLVFGALLPIFFLILVIMGSSFYGIQDTLKMVLSMCFRIFLHLCFYYVILGLLLPLLRRYISARACAMLWLIPNYLYIMEFGTKLKELRAEKGVSQAKLAADIHISRSAVAKWENGLGLPNDESLRMLSEYFSIPISDLIPDKTNAETIVSKNKTIDQQKKAIIGLAIGCAIGLLILAFIFIEPLRDSLELLGLGAIIAALGIFNLRGNIASIHWYNRRKVTKENQLPYCRCVGLGTLIVGLSMIASGIVQAFVGIEVGGIIIIVGFMVGLSLIVYAQFKYNKGIF